MLVEQSDKQWKTWDDIARNEGRKKAGKKGKPDLLFWAHI